MYKEIEEVIDNMDKQKDWKRSYSEFMVRILMVRIINLLKMKILKMTLLRMLLLMFIKMGLFQYVQENLYIMDRQSCKTV